MGDVEDGADLVHGVEEVAAAVGEGGVCAGAAGVLGVAEVDEADGAEAGLPPVVELGGGDDAVGAFGAEEET